MTGSAAGRSERWIGTGGRSALVFGLLYCLFGALTLGITTDWSADEILYLDGALIMMDGGDPMVPEDVTGAPRFQKPPLFYWMVLASYRLFGVSLPAGRLPALLLGLACMGLLYLLAGDWGRDARRGANAVFILGACYVFFYHARTAVTDVLVTCGMVGGVLLLVRCLEGRGAAVHLYGAAVFLGIAAMAKGPVGLVLTALGLGAALALPGGRRTLAWTLPRRHTVGAALLLFVLSSWWYLLMFFRFGEGFLSHQAGVEVGARVADSLAMRALNAGFYLQKILASAYPWSIILLVLVAMRVRPSGHPMARRIAWGFTAALLGFYVLLIGRSTSRYLVPLLPFMAMGISDLFTTALEDPATGRRVERVLRLLSASIAVLFGGFYAALLMAVRSSIDLSLASRFALFGLGSIVLFAAACRARTALPMVASLVMVLNFSGTLLLLKDPLRDRPSIAAARMTWGMERGRTVGMGGLGYLERGFLFFYGDRSRILRTGDSPKADYAIVRAADLDPARHQIAGTVSTRVRPDSAAYLAAIRSGDLLLRFERKPAYYLVRMKGGA